MIRTRTVWKENHVLALIAGYGEYKCVESHPTLKKNFWKSIIEFVYTKVGTRFTEAQAKSKWRTMKDTYQLALTRMRTSGESYSTFKYFDEMDQFLGHHPINATGQSLNVGTSVIRINVSNENEDDDDELEDDNDGRNYIENEADEMLRLDLEDNFNNSSSDIENRQPEIQPNQLDAPVPGQENVNTLPIGRCIRRRRRRDTNVDKLLKFKEKEMDFNKFKFKKKMEYLKERDSERSKIEREKEEARAERHRERRTDFINAFGNGAMIEEYLVQ